MAIDPNLVSIIPASELPTGVPTSAGQFFFYEGNEMKKSPMTEIYELVSGLKGTLKITDTAPTTQGLYILSDVGTYTNLGGLVTTAGKINYAYFDGTTWSKVEVEVAVANPDFNPANDTEAPTMKGVADYMPLYEVGKNKLNKATFVDNTILTPSGATFTQSPWKTTGFLEVPSSTEISIKDARFFAQYDINKVFIPGTFVDNTTQVNLTLTTNASTVYFKQTVLDTKINTASVEVGAAVTAYESYRITLSKRKGDNAPLKFAPLMDSTASAELEPFTLQSRLRDYILGESFTISSATYTDGIIESPVTVGYPDGATGTLTITRNADMAVTKIVATHIKGSVTTSVTINITRNSDNNVTSITLS